MKRLKENEIDIIIPITLELNHPKKEDIVKDILYMHRNYGFCRFGLAGPGGTHRAWSYPSREVFRSLAELFAAVKNELAPYGIDCGWWITATLKSGPSGDFCRQVRADGTEHGFSNCPADPGFRKRFCEDIAFFADIAQPSFIVTEDDFSVAAAGGCFCKHHLEEFAKMQGRYYTREELVSAMSENTPEAIELCKSWYACIKKTLVDLSALMRRAIDEKNPQIPMGYMQSGGADRDGDVTLDVSKALAGPNHVPFSRFFGTFYGGFFPKRLPYIFCHPLYTRQHTEGDFIFYHESDTFPHTRHFTSGSQMNALMGIAYSCGFVGSVFQAVGLLDNAVEESAYGKMFARERTRFNAVAKLAEGCELRGVGIAYDPFYNWYDADIAHRDPFPMWSQVVGRFGIPYTTLESEVFFWDDRQARYKSDAEIKKALSKGLFLDGDAAKVLCERGYGQYLGVCVGEDVTEGNTLVYDLGVREIICDAFATDGMGKNMHSAHMLSNGGNGKMRRLEVTDVACEIVTEYYNGLGELICPSMTVFENCLGGKVAVMGLTLRGNGSQALYNYRRQKLIQKLLTRFGDPVVYAEDAPDVFAIMNVPKTKGDFKALLTLVNLCEDSLDEIKLHLPSDMRDVSEICFVDRDGDQKPCGFRKDGDSIVVDRELPYLLPGYLVLK